MEISFIDECCSTQEVLVNAIKSGRIAPPFALVAARQTAGTGSRGNEWISRSGNLHFSFAISASELPSDLPTSSASIYFAFLMREFLSELGSKIWLKWPNDFYLNEKKTGGVITTKICENFVCGIGLNLAAAPEFAGILDVKISPQSAVSGFIKYLEKKISWKLIFRKFLLEFQKSRKYCVHLNGREVSLGGASLCADGSIFINGEKVYSNR